MLAAPMEGMDYGGGLGAGYNSAPASSPASNPFLSNWGPLASKSDQLYIPGYSDPKQGTFSQPTQQPPSLVAEAPTASKQSASQVSDSLPTSGLKGWLNLTWGPLVQKNSPSMYNSFLRSIATPSQLNGYNGNSSLTGGRQ
jgi:hypothetical protein